MNWDAIGAIGEIVGAIAVVVSIIYLSIQIRSNTKTERARASFDASSSWSIHNEWVSQLPDEFIEAFMLLAEDEPDLESIPYTTVIKIGVFQRSVFQKLESHYYLRKYGLMEESIWELRRAWSRGIIELPFWKNWWEKEKQELMFSTEFIENIESASPLPMGVYDWENEIRSLKSK